MPAAPRPPQRRSPRGDIPLGRISGIPFSVAPSWLVAATVIVVLMMPVVPRLVPGADRTTSIAAGIVLAIALGLSVLIHELGHCWVARLFHLPIRRVRLYVIGGASELGRLPATPGEEAGIAGAGPLVSGLLGVAAWLALPLTTPGTVTWLVVLELALTNGIIAAFNILPALPLDGGRVLRAVVWRLTGRRHLGSMAGVVGGFLVATALLAAAAVFWQRGGTNPGLQTGIFAVMGLFVAVGASAEWPTTAERRGHAGGDDHTPGGRP